MIDEISDFENFVKGMEESEQQTDSIIQGSAALTEQAEKVIKARNARDRANDEYKNLSALFEIEAKKLLKILEASELEQFRAHGYSFSPDITESVTVPKELEDKRKLFDFLKERGIFEQTVSVNSQSLQSLYKACAKEALERGELEFRLPGCGEPKPYVKLKVRKN